MGKQHYLRILKDNKFTFVLAGYNEILETDIPVSEEDFTEYLNTKDIIKHYRLKGTTTGTGLFDYLEEYTPEILIAPPTELELLQEEVLEQSEYMVEMDYRLMNLELGL